jgi:hypothetical protein
MIGTVTWLMTLVPALLGLAIAAFLIILLYRLVTAVERIADYLRMK